MIKTQTRSNLGRPPAKKNEIVSQLRAHIVTGKIPPAGRLPTRRELGIQYRASLPTVQQALDVLVSDGFVHSRGTRGTFVVDDPPHLSRYALVFPRHPYATDAYWTRFWTALANEAIAIERTSALHVPIFYGIDGHTDTEDYQRLLGELESHTLAGLIFATQPSGLRGTPLIDHPDVPRVAIMGPGFESLHIGRVGLDAASFFDRAVEYLIQRGRKRLAFISRSEDTGRVPLFDAAVARNGVSSPPWWRQFVPIAPPDCAAHVAMLLTHPNQTERPDGLFIADDNLVESVTSGLTRAGMRVPEDMDIVAHCNFPWQPPSILPVKRLGFDSRQALRACMANIDAQRRGEGTGVASISAIFDHEIDPADQTMMAHQMQMHAPIRQYRR